MTSQARMDVLLSLKDNMSRGMRDASRNMASAGQSMERVGQRMTMGLSIPLAAATLAMRALGETAQKLQVEESFNRMAAGAGMSADKIISGLDKAAAGTVSRADLMLAANKGMALGVAKNTDDFVKLMEIARDRARVMGMTTTAAFNDIVTGLGRGSPLILDNLGLVVKLGEAQENYAKSIGKSTSELTESEKKQALINSVMQQAERTIDRAALATDTQADELNRLTAEFSNLQLELTRTILPVVTSVMGVFLELPGPIQKTALAMGILLVVAGPLSTVIGLMATGLVTATTYMYGLRTATLLTARSMRTLRYAMALTGIGAIVVAASVVADRTGLLDFALGGGGDVTINVPESALVVADDEDSLDKLSAAVKAAIEEAQRGD